MVVKVSQGNFETIFLTQKKNAIIDHPPEKKSATAATAHRSGSLKTPECGGVADVADVFEGEDGREGRWGRRCAGCEAPYSDQAAQPIRSLSNPASKYASCVIVSGSSS